MKRAKAAKERKIDSFFIKVPKQCASSAPTSSNESNDPPVVAGQDKDTDPWNVRSSLNNSSVTGGQQEATVSVVSREQQDLQPAVASLSANITPSSRPNDQRPNLSNGPLDSPTQPQLLDFPSSEGRRFNPKFYETHPWVEYDVNTNSTFCFSCRHFVLQSDIRRGEEYGERAFIDKGVKQWKLFSRKVEKHESSLRHKNSMDAWIQFKIRTKNDKAVASLQNAQRTVEITENRRHIKVLLKVTKFLGKQGLPFRGDDESNSSSNRGNFVELVQAFCEDDSALQGKISRRYGHYCSPEYQNDLLAIFLRKIKGNIVGEVNAAQFYAICADETKDASRKEQLALVVRYVRIEHGKVAIKERPIGCQHLKDCGAENISKLILQTLEEEGIPKANCVGQCYDGASVMKGVHSGVQMRIKEEVPHAMYVHCHAHRLNLVIVSMITQNEELRNFFNVIKKLYVFISKSSPRHEAFIESQKKKRVIKYMSWRGRLKQGGTIGIHL